jgi:aromatic-L-amino-acid decarboxylase
VRLAREMAGWVDAEPFWERMAPTPLSLVVFRHRPPGLSDNEVNAHNERLMALANDTGRMFISHTRLGGRVALRFAIGNIRTQEEHVREAWEILKRAAEDDLRARS